MSTRLASDRQPSHAPGKLGVPGSTRGSPHPSLLNALRMAPSTSRFRVTTQGVRFAASSVTAVCPPTTDSGSASQIPPDSLALHAQDPQEGAPAGCAGHPQCRGRLSLPGPSRTQPGVKAPGPAAQPPAHAVGGSLSGGPNPFSTGRPGLFPPIPPDLRPGPKSDVPCSPQGLCTRYSCPGPLAPFTPEPAPHPAS